MTANATLPDVYSNFGSVAIELPKIMFHASGRREPHQTWQFNTRTRLTNGSITYPPNKLHITNLSMDLPIDYPDASANQTGVVKIAAIQWNDRPIGGISGTLKQTPQGLKMATPPE